MLNTIGKAQLILRARLPRLTAERLNFEKRTGNFFRANETAEGVIARNVVNDLPTDAECVEEINVKRASARVVKYDKARAELLNELERASARVEAVEAEINYLDIEFESDKARVEAYALPERESVATLSAKNADLLKEIERMRALLVNAGITE